MSGFKDSQEANFRRMVRQAVRKGDFTKGERDVTLAVINMWFHHKGGPKPYIHPGREKIAKKAGVTVKTVSRCLSMLRSAGVLVAVNGLSGGGKIATKYTVNVWSLMTLCGCDWVDEFMRGRGKNVPLSSAEMSHCRRDKMSHSNIGTFKPAFAKGGSNA